MISSCSSYWNWYFGHSDAGDNLVLVTSLCWWQNDFIGDLFSLCWWHFRLNKSLTNILNGLNLVTNTIRLQHPSPTLIIQKFNVGFHTDSNCLIQTKTDLMGAFVIKMTYLVFYIYCCMLDSPLNSTTNCAVRYKISKLSNKTFSYITLTVYFWRVKSKLDDLRSKWTVHGDKTGRTKRLTMSDK